MMGHTTVFLSALISANKGSNQPEREEREKLSSDYWMSQLTGNDIERRAIAHNDTHAFTLRGLAVSI